MTAEPKSEGAVTREKQELDPGALANLESLVRALVENLPFTLKHTAAAQVFGAYLAGLGGEYLAWLRLIHQASRVTAAEKRAETAERENERLESEADAFCEAAGGAVNTSAAIEWCKRQEQARQEGYERGKSSPHHTEKCANCNRTLEPRCANCD